MIPLCHKVVELGRVGLVSWGEAISRAREHRSILGILRSSASTGLWQRGTTAIIIMVMNIPPTLAELIAPGVKFKVCDSSVLELAVMVWRCSDTAGSRGGSGRVCQLKGVRGKAVRGPGLTALI